MPSKKGVGINPASQIHYIDHLAVVCSLMKIPLIFIDEKDYELAKQHYPDLNAQWEEYQTFSPEYLIANYDVLFMSDLWDRYTFHEKFGPLEKKYHKTLRHVHCPHGFSDKGFYLRKCAQEDITLIYGQNMIDLLKAEGVFEALNAYVITGNYRYTYFKRHRAFFDKIVQKEVLSHFDKKRPVILYAPTWLDLEESTTFFEAADTILSRLPPDYNMIVKLHPRLELDDTVKFFQVLGKYEGRGNILFLKDFPLVYPLLAHTDIYIGDNSSVGYDFLVFNRPMFFLNKYRRDSQTDRSVYLFRAGVSLSPESFARLYQVIEAHSQSDWTRFTKIRQEMYHYTFGRERPFEEIRQGIIQAYT